MDVPQIALDQAQEAQLGERLTVWGRDDHDAWAVRVVDAPPELVWQRILDYDAYASTWPYVTRSRLESVGAEGGDPVYVSSLSLTTKGVTTSWSMRSEVHLDEGWLSFDAAPGGRGPVQAAHGWWRLEPWRGDARRTLVAYAVTIDPRWWVPDALGAAAERRLVPLVLDWLARRLEPGS
jgi:hypothetical protein